ncbi:MAG: HAMP domain-containing protein [Ignavibacterium album]|uniref:ATP-binding protein n=2 Tax=Ignavibacterium TaxID=795750 RepID=UPI0026F2D7A5|nr:ATP-binding protein [Ignavibacterium album]MBI5661402.1 HAMP domain-containing protein [Ignavibacterium album]
MINWLGKKFKGDRKYFSIVFFIFLMIPVSGIITNRVIEKTKSDWFDILTQKINALQTSIINDFNTEQRKLQSIVKELKSKLVVDLTNSEESYKTFVEILNDKKFENYSLEIFAPNGKLIAWSKSVAINQNELFPLPAPLGDIYFLEKPLAYYISIIDTIHIDSDVFYLTANYPIQLKYSLTNPFFRNDNFSDKCSEKYSVECWIDYNPFTSPTKDGKKFSFELLNNNEKKIGLVTINKPTLYSELNSIREVSANIQALLVLIALIFTGLGLKTDYKNLKSLKIKFVLFVLYIIIVRVIIFFLDLPSRIISGPISDPANFSSTFALGIVKSPIEFLVTNIFLVLIAIQFYRYTFNYLTNIELKKKKFIFRIFSVVLFTAIVLLMRGFAAAIRSVIFDSKLRYFKDPDILPDFTLLSMHLNILLIGFAAIAAILGLLNIILKLHGFNQRKNNFKLLSVTYFALIAVSLILFYLSNDPLVNLLILIIIDLAIILVSYQITCRSQASVFNYVLILLVGSVFSITLLNYFNSKLEKESLKTTAYELNRIDENLIQFYLSDLILQSSSDPQILSSFARSDLNFDALAFIQWSGSILQRESMNSFLAFYDRFGNKKGSFEVGMISKDKIFLSKIPLTDEIVFINSAENSIEKNIVGIKRISESGITRGFIASGIDFNISKLGAKEFPDFIESNLSILNQVVNVKQLKIFLFLNNELAQVYGDIYPSREQIKQILNTKLDSTFNDGWMKIDFSGEAYETYLLKTYNNGNEILTVISVADKEFSWNLFNFFKVFFVHAIFILILFVILFIVRIRKINYTFRTKILFAFLFVSIIPVIVLAIYNRQVVEDRSKESIFNELKQRADYVQSHIESQANKNKSRDIIQSAGNASNELRISFSLFDGTEQIYNSDNIYSKIELMDRKLNSDAYYHLHYLRMKEYLTKEKINSYPYDSYYRQIKVNNREFILSVNDAFNKIKIPFSTTEIDVVIFGIYSFVVLLIVLFSTIFANQISSPIQKLTKAAEAVGKGDLNVQIRHKAKGEIKELLDGFNLMTMELKKNQMELAELERESAWKEMAKQVAHEIKNPLTPMKLAIQQLMAAYREKHSDFDKLFDRVSNTILNQIDNLSQIASEFSRFAKMPSLKIEVVDLIKEINNTINIFINERVKISLDTELNEALIEADANQLSRMFINFIRNSIQANASKIIINVKRVEDNFEIRISDNGTGIAEDIRDKIFNENFTTKSQGMGLGLSMAKRFIENINGRILLESTSGKGTTFKIIIPVFNKT